MKTHFTRLADLGVPVVDADAHVNEPPELWQERVPAKLRERAPKVVSTPDGDHWSFEDGTWTRPLGLSATAGPRRDAVPVRGHAVRGHAAGVLRTQGAARGSRRRRHRRAGHLPVDRARRRTPVHQGPRAAARLRARLQRVAGRLLHRLRRPARRHGDHAHHRRRRRGRRAGARARVGAPRRDRVVLPERHARCRSRRRPLLERRGRIRPAGGDPPGLVRAPSRVALPRHARPGVPRACRSLEGGRATRSR